MGMRPRRTAARASGASPRGHPSRWRGAAAPTGQPRSNRLDCRPRLREPPVPGPATTMPTTDPRHPGSRPGRGPSARSVPIAFWAAPESWSPCRVFLPPSWTVHRSTCWGGYCTIDGVRFHGRSSEPPLPTVVYPDVVIGQRRVKVGDGHLGHVAVEATRGRVNRAGTPSAGRRQCGRSRDRGRVTRQASHS